MSRLEIAQNTYSWRLVKGAEGIQPCFAASFQALVKRCLGHLIDCVIIHLYLAMALVIFDATGILTH